MDDSAITFLSQNSSRKVRKLLGRAYLHEYRIADAINVYLGLFRDYPADADSLYVLGNLYWLVENLRTAGRLYRRALEICPAHPLALGQLNRLSNRSFSEAWDENALLGPAEIAQLSGQLAGLEDAEQRQEVREAADRLDQLASVDRPSQPLGKIPADLQQLMPALIEQNIRQARAGGMVELAEALQSLHINLIRQADNVWSHDGAAGEGSATAQSAD